MPLFPVTCFIAAEAYRLYLPQPWIEDRQRRKCLSKHLLHLPRELVATWALSSIVDPDSLYSIT
jgi:hypothetical protein